MDQTRLDELLRRARRLDADALTELVDLYTSRVYGLVYRLTGAADVAEDLLQETFLRVVRGIGHYEHVGKFEAWLFRIAANLARDHVRRRRRRGEVALDAASEADEIATAATHAAGADEPLTRLALQETEQRLVAGLARLSDAEREVILLRHYSELSFREIAELLGIPLGTALARAHRALGHLRELIAEEE